MAPRSKTWVATAARTERRRLQGHAPFSRRALQADAATLEKWHRHGIKARLTLKRGLAAGWRASPTATGFQRFHAVMDTGLV